MPRITRIHFASLGHHDARFPALTLNLCDSRGHATDTVLWAENSTGKTSLLSLFFSTFQTRQTRFLGKQAEGKARELGDYVRSRDLAFVVTEWDTTDDRAEAGLLDDAPRELLLVGQALSWRGLDTANELRRLFFTLRPNRAVTLDTLPVLGLGQPASSFEAFRDWLDAQNKAYPKLEVRHTTNQGEWSDHLENNHLDPELFTYQLRMNESEGGINNLFNDLKGDRDFIRLFLQLGFDPAAANQVRANLEEFLPKLRRRDVLLLQLEFNEKLLVDLDLFLKQLALWEEAKARGAQAEHAAGAVLMALRAARERFSAEAARLAQRNQELECENTRLTSARTGNVRRQNFFNDLKCRLDVDEAKAELVRCEGDRTLAQTNRRLVEMAGLLGEISLLRTQAAELDNAILRQQTQAKPVLEALRILGSRYKFRIEAEAQTIQTRVERAETERKRLRGNIRELEKKRSEVAVEQARKQQELITLECFFSERESHRERLRREGLLEAKEAAADAVQRWSDCAVKADAAITRATAECNTARAEEKSLAAQAAQLAKEVAEAGQRQQQLTKTIQEADVEEERIAKHPQMRAAVEASRADLNLPQTAERLRERSARLLRRIFRLNLEGAEDERARDYVEKNQLFPPHCDVEAVLEGLRAAGVSTATAAAQWLAFNVTDKKTAGDLLASDPARFGGVMFDAAAEADKIAAAFASISTDQVPVTLSPLPDAPLSHNGEQSLVVLPRHGGGYNFAEAKAEGEKLAGQIASRRSESDQLNTDLTEARQLVCDLERWLDEFGGSKLGTLREQLRGEQQSLESLNVRQQKNATRQKELTDAIAEAEKTIQDQREAQRNASAAVIQLESFIERFDTEYESKRAGQQTLSARLQDISVELPTLEEQRLALESSEKPIEERLTALNVQKAELTKEASNIVYADAPPQSVDESLEQLRTRYEAEVRRYEDRFLNTKAQGELTVKQNLIQEKKGRVDKEFAGLDHKVAEARLAAGDLPGQIQSAEAKLQAANKAEGAAELNLKEARKRLKELGAPGEQERPGQSELIPATAREADDVLSKLTAEYEELQQQLDANRREGDAVAQAHSRFTQRAANYGNHAMRLADQNPPEDGPAEELPDDDARVAALVDERLRSLKATRTERDAERDKLRGHFDAIQQLTQEDRYAQATDLPARSLFAHMPLDELVACAAAKRTAVEEDTLTLRADLEQMNAHRETIVESLLNVSEQAIRLLERAERWSRMPETMNGWENEPFLRIRLHCPQSRQENVARLKSLVDLILEEGKIPGGIELVLRAVLALVGETGVDATILKPEAQRRKTRYPVREMSSWSEGERTTVAILLYCTLVKIRAQSRGHAGRRAEVSALLLDNPVGPCSKREFLEMHRWIAGQLGVQLIYATGVNDPQALSIFPNRVRLAKNRIVPETGELAVGVVGAEAESAVSEIRIFDGLGEERA